MNHAIVSRHISEPLALDHAFLHQRILRFENTPSPTVEEPRIGLRFASLNSLVYVQIEIEIALPVFLLLSSASGNSRADRENDLVAQDI